VACRGKEFHYLLYVGGIARPENPTDLLKEGARSHFRVLKR